VLLKSHNSFQVSATAAHFLTINSPADLSTLTSLPQPILTLGLGCNTLFVHDWPGTILKNNLSGITTISETDQTVTLTVQSGHNWHDLVTWSVDHNLSGIENMALIPGTVGAAAHGNIAAYGQSFDQVFISLQAIDITTGQTRSFSKIDCQLGYRESIFKHALKDRFFITDVTLSLSKTAHFDTHYYSRRESLLQELEQVRTDRLQRASQAGIHSAETGVGANEKHSANGQFSISDVYQAVINIRTKKLPDWTKIGTAGSVFKNPFVTHDQLATLQSQVPELQYYPTTGMDYPALTDPSLQIAKYVKIPVGRLLDVLGWRGKTIGHVSTHPSHALVVINSGGASGQEIFEYCELMRQDIKSHYSLDLEYEIQIV
jgi:UDP-N-acetylmuramate dehydrogenase